MLLIVQPWFSAVGHPAQSLINTAKTVGARSGIAYLISVISNSDLVETAKEELQQLGEVVEYPVKTDSVREGTVKALLSIKTLLVTDFSIDRIFFLDAHLVLLAALWPFCYQKRIKRLSVTYLMGPERVARYKIVKVLIEKFLKRKEVSLFLRTEELVIDWKKVFPESSIKCLPSLEIPTDDVLPDRFRLPNEVIHFGILGQIRAGKSIEWLVPVFKNNPYLGKLIIAGTFNNPKQKQALAVLAGFEGFQDKFLTEEELLSRAIEQDYLLMLYDNWDHRMEGAVMYLAARVNRPVIVYNKGWCGRMVHTYKNGLIAPDSRSDFDDFIKQVPRADSVEYKHLLKGMHDFKMAHSGATALNAFLEVLQD